jgi:hypothetical protein
MVHVLGATIGSLFCKCMDDKEKLRAIEEHMCDIGKG